MQFDLNIHRMWNDWSDKSDHLVQFVMDITPETTPLHQRREFDIAKVARGTTRIRNMSLYYDTKFESSKVMRMNRPVNPGMAREVTKEQEERLKREEEKRRKKAAQEANQQDARSTATFGHDSNDPDNGRWDARTETEQQRDNAKWTENRGRWGQPQPSAQDSWRGGKGDCYGGK